MSLQEVQFKLHDKFVAFNKCGDPRSNVNLLAVSSSRGLLFAGNPTAPELKGKNAPKKGKNNSII